MKRVPIAPRAAAIALGLLQLFATGGALIGALLLVGAERIARVTHGDASAYRWGVVIGALAGTGDLRARAMARDSGEPSD